MPAPFHILRVSLGITFAWVGLLILKEPEFWTGFLDPWFQEALPIAPVTLMIATAIFDLLIGLFLLMNFWIWQIALLASLHLLGIILLSGIDEITIRNIGLLGASLALFVQTRRR